MLFFITRNIGTPDVCGLLHNSLLLSATHSASTEPSETDPAVTAVCAHGVLLGSLPAPPARLGGSEGSALVCLLHVVPGALPCLCVWLGVPSELHRGRWLLQGARRCLGIAVPVPGGFSGAARSN